MPNSNSGTYIDTTDKTYRVIHRKCINCGNYKMILNRDRDFLGTVICTRCHFKEKF